MKLVIDIADEDYNNIEPFLNGQTIKGGFNIFKLLEMIKNGIKLPKGHGRLIDADELKQNDEIALWLSRDAVRTGKMLKILSRLFIKKIDDAPTIIEADAESEGEKDECKTESEKV